jgi:hypothetical protein
MRHLLWILVAALLVYDTPIRRDYRKVYGRPGTASALTEGWSVVLPPPPTFVPPMPPDFVPGDLVPPAKARQRLAPDSSRAIRPPR